MRGKWCANPNAGTPVRNAARCPTTGDSSALSVRRPEKLTLDRQEESPHKASLQFRILRFNFLRGGEVGVGGTQQTGAAVPPPYPINLLRAVRASATCGKRVREPSKCERKDWYSSMACWLLPVASYSWPR